MKHSLCVLPYFFFLDSWVSFFFGAFGVYRLVSILAAMVFMMVLGFTGYWYLQEFVDFSFLRITIFFFVIYVDTFFTIHLDMIILMEIGLHWGKAMGYMCWKGWQDKKYIAREKLYDIWMGFG